MTPVANSVAWPIVLTSTAPSRIGAATLRRGQQRAHKEPAKEHDAHRGGALNRKTVADERA